MATTTNFGWETPDDTDLVKDGALAMRTLGNAIDASLVDLKGGTTGQVLSKTSNTDMDFTWVTSDDANAIQNAIVDAKGDLIAATAADTPARLAVGNNGETLVADSSASTGLRWQGNFAAGKNKVINGDFRINQRSFTSITTNATYGFDRWLMFASGGTVTHSTQAFTPGTAPVTGYEAINFARIVSSGQSAASDRAALAQRIEDCRTFAGQTVTVSFWAKSGSGTPNLAVNLTQNFGSGGSSAVSVDGQKVAISTSWARYSLTFSVPSVSGKTIGTSSFLQFAFYMSAGADYNQAVDSLGIQNNTFDVWGAQIEAGNTATAFQTATGTLAGEFAAACRYYQIWGGVDSKFPVARGYGGTGEPLYYPISFPVELRTTPTVTFSGTWTTTNCTVPEFLFNSTKGTTMKFTVTTAGMAQLYPNSTDDTVAFSAEL